MEETYIPSTDQRTQLHVVMWKPMEEVRAVVQISHGMMEYVKRYGELAAYLNQYGIFVIGSDHLGHGESVKTEADLGYFCKSNMSAVAVADLHRVTRYAKKRYPNVPYFLFGHSMGSFFVRRYLMTYGSELDGAILSGTGRESCLRLDLGRVLAAGIKMVKGDRYRSPFLQSASFAGFNSHIRNPKSENAWISRNQENVRTYDQDPLCTFDFTVNGYRTLYSTLAFIQNRKNIEKIPKDLPIFMISGTEDPVGEYGAGVKKIYRCYRKHGIEDIELLLYEGDRHELLKEADKEEVFLDIAQWLNKQI